MTTASTDAPARPSSIAVRPPVPHPERPVQVHISGSPAAAVSKQWWRAAMPTHPWVWLAALVIACGWDRAIWLGVAGRTMPNIEAIEAISLRAVIASMFSWHRADAFASIGFLGYHAIKFFGTVWVPAAIAAWLILRPLAQTDAGRVRIALRRGVLLFLAPAAAGLAAEALKLVFRRQRPEFADGYFSFRFHDFWSGSGLGLPSSHAAVAIASGLALSILWPRWRSVWYTLAGCCAISRVLAGAHFTSDVLLGVLVGLCAARAVVALDLKNNHGLPVPA